MIADAAEPGTGRGPDVAAVAPLLRSLAHDLAEPLRTVKGYLDLLERHLGESADAEAREFLSHALRGATNARDRVDALSAWARSATRTLQRTSVDLDAALDGALAELAPELATAHAELVREPLPMVQGDAAALSEVLERLVANACRYRSDAPLRLDVLSRVDRGHVFVHLRDNGIGFEARLAERAFEPFARLHPGRSGLGMGLAVARCLVERHGGLLTASAAPGAGASFTLTLPLGGPDA